LPTPSLVLDAGRMKRNAESMSRRVLEMGARLRPHIKTHKCIEVARIQTDGQSGAVTVSTLAEARGFVAAGFRDITYAVPIEPGKFEAAIEIATRCDRFGLITDNTQTPALLNEAAKRAGIVIDLFLKVDCGYHRCGVAPDSAEALTVPRAITAASHLRFAGILTHAGHSYHCRTQAERLTVARQERDVMLEMASRLRNEGIEVPTVSIGSTPSITAVDHLDGIDEVRPGNYIFFDTFQAAAGSCQLNDCALTVLAAVVHRDLARGKVIIDAGAIALSKDRGAVEFDPDCGYGLVLDLEGNDLGLRVSSLSQEHGELIATSAGDLQSLKIGTRVRVLANHSCLTAAQHSHYNVLDDGKIVDRWEILRGW
jgi:D-serine deaminase-like pyridoxal phosphate-dependent protein